MPHCRLRDERVRPALRRGRRSSSGAGCHRRDSRTCSSSELDQHRCSGADCRPSRVMVERCSGSLFVSTSGRTSPAGCRGPHGQAGSAESSSDRRAAVRPSREPRRERWGLGIRRSMSGAAARRPATFCSLCNSVVMSYPIRGVRSGFCSSFPRGATVTDLAAEREYAVLNWRKILRLYAVAIICLAALVALGCAGSESSPTAPSSTDAAPPAEPGSPGRMSVSISPNPVPWSGAAVVRLQPCQPLALRTGVDEHRGHDRHGERSRRFLQWHRSQETRRSGNRAGAGR